MTLYVIRNKGIKIYVIKLLVMADIPQSIRDLVVHKQCKANLNAK